MATPAPCRVGLDIGGTFTDLVLLHEPSGALLWHKVLTTPRDPAEGALRGLYELCGRADAQLADIGALIHATTLVTNAIIERKGARTALLTTEGFRDILEIGKEQRYDIYDLFLQFPDPLVPRRWRVEVRERVTRDGEVRTPIDPAAVREQVARLVAAGVEAIAVTFLHSYKNPAHERIVANLVRREFPQISISISSEVSPEIREYERTCTTVCNAYVQPVMDRYIQRIESALAEGGFAGRFLLMLSSGTLAVPEVARRFPVRMLESGPAAGALVAGHLGRQAGRGDLVGFDMGGTTAKICLVRDGRPKVASTLEVARVHRFKKGSGFPVVTPVVDMIEIGAGGGSIAQADAMGLLRVGPQSAGADPGPACYGFGGAEATVTDACVLLGYFDPGAFLGGSIRLDPGAARAALAKAGAPVGLDALKAAWGIYSIVCENMAQAARLYLIERGLDPRRFTLMGFGGAGPATAARVARLLGLREVMIPPASGLASALGLLVAPLGFDFGHSVAGTLDELDWNAVERLYQEMESQGRAMVAAAGVDPHLTQSARRAEMRYAGQFQDIEVAIPPRLDADASEAIRDRFIAEYARLYGVTLLGYAVQALNWRVRVTGPASSVDIRGSFDAERDAGRSVVTSRQVYIPEAGRFVEVPVYNRYRLPEGGTITGPAIVQEAEATTVVWPGDHLTVDAQRNLVIQVEIPSEVTAPAGGGIHR
jgi:5-oxoprolinase (ATP-hydrolysing)